MYSLFEVMLDGQCDRPHLSIYCGFFLCSYLKEKELKHCLQTLSEQKDWTIKEVNAIPCHICNQAIARSYSKL